MSVWLTLSTDDSGPLASRLYQWPKEGELFELVSPPTSPCSSNGWCRDNITFQLVEAITEDGITSCSEQMYDISSTMSTYSRSCCPALTCNLVQGSHHILCILTFSNSEYTLYHYLSYQLQYIHSAIDCQTSHILKELLPIHQHGKNIWQDTRSPLSAKFQWTYITKS